MQSEMTRIFVMTKLQESVDTQNWTQLRVMYFYLMCHFPKIAKDLRAKLTGEAKDQLEMAIKMSSNAKLGS